MVGESVGPFRVIHKLGAGGMGEVYLAEDPRLARRVALKCPSDSFLSDPDGRARLQREARAAARLNHPRIAGVYDIIDVTGRPFIVMEYVEGETLSACLRRGPLPVDRALALGIDIADALTAAHACGVIHRDLKPGNIILTDDGHLKVLDFGLAKARQLVEDRDAEPPSHLTHPGQILGTPGYVAPEQLLARPADARSDLYSAGAVLYQMLTGRAPFGQVDAMGRALAALLEPVRPAHEVNPNVPLELSRIVARAMARNPGERFQSAGELRSALESIRRGLEESPTSPLGTAPRLSSGSRPRWQAATLVLVAAVGVGVLIAWWGIVRQRSPGVASGSPPVVAVLPFENLSGDESLQYVGAGMAETMSTMLASLPEVSVVGRSEIHEALGRSRELPRVARVLGASYVATGGVQRVGERLQVSLTLQNPEGRILAGDIYEDEYENLFALQRRMAEGLMRRVVGTISGDARDRLEKPPAGSVEALSEYWRGRELLERPGAETVDSAIEAFENATRIDPAFGVGYAGLGSAYWRKYAIDREPRWAGLAVEATERARQLAPSEPYVGYSLAIIYRGNGRLDDAIAELQRVLTLQPVHEGARRALGETYAEQGKFDQAIEELKSALRIRPDYWATYRSLGLAHMRAGRYVEAAQAFERYTALQPEVPFGYQLLGNVHASMGDFEAAQQDYELAIERGGSPATYSSLGVVYYFLGRYADAARVTERAIELRPRSGITHYNLGDTYLRLGRTTDASRAYERAIELFDAELDVNPGDGGALALRATCEARLGRTAQALEQIEQSVQLSPEDADVHYQHAIVLILAGRNTEAMAALEDAVQKGYSAALASRDPALEPLRSNPRFATVVADPQGK